jgi:hypothetical protein
MSPIDAGPSAMDDGRVVEGKTVAPSGRRSADARGLRHSAGWLQVMLLILLAVALIPVGHAEECEGCETITIPIDGGDHRLAAASTQFL